MTGNVTTLKKVISLMLLGSLLVAGATVYADSVAQSTTEKTDRPARTAGPRGDMDGTLLTDMVSAGVITAEEQAQVTKALETQRAEREAQREADKAAGVKPEKPAEGVKPAEGEKPASQFDRLAEADLISQDLADRIDTYLAEKREANFAEAIQPLIDSGAFADADAVKAAQEALREAMKAQLDALKPADGEKPERVDFKSLTDDEKAALKEKMEAAREDMQAKHEATMKAVYDQLVSDGKLTQAQADALQAFKGPENGFGHGRGPGEPPAKTAE